MVGCAGEAIGSAEFDAKKKFRSVAVIKGGGK